MCIKSGFEEIILKLATYGQRENAFLLSSKFCPEWIVCHCPGLYTYGEKMYINRTSKPFFLNLQQMGKVIRAFCWHQKFVPKGLSALAPGLFTYIKSFKMCIKSDFFLAHLSQGLTRWAYSIPMVHHRRSHFQTWIYLWSKLASLDQILYVASLGWGKGCIRFWGRLNQSSGFHGNRKPPLTYNGENNVSTFSRLFLIRSFLYLQVTRTCIKSRASSNFGQIGPLS